MFGISIHAPTRGATFASFSVFPFLLFQSTLLQEERQQHTSAALTLYFISIHAPTRGATFYILPSMTFRYLFQSTLLQEERLHKNCCQKLSLQFQSTLLQEERP